ncbi:MAG: ribokinase [Acidobacteriia bacterium]|nr:ribokinase [Terriglobia bacterium]MYG02875.1 ribokinase [Terriglobia bacterium]MYK08846.1 ribokinase [Terriglobia bacterium]
MTCSEILERSSSVRALVIGDICLDRWCKYDPALAEPSRETGIPRCAVTETVCTPGAGGTVAGNLKSLGAGRVRVIGAIGNDGAGRDLREALDRASIESNLLAFPDVQTFTYTKLINSETGVEDLPRVDFVNTAPLNPAHEHALVGTSWDCLQEFNVVVVADQAETAHGGTVTANVRRNICEVVARCPGAVFVADSRRRVEHFRNVIATPNESEATAACRRAFGAVDYARLHRLIGGPATVVTAAERGAWLIDDDGERLLPPPQGVTVVDPCGAGDSLSAGFAFALAVGATTEAALRFGIIVAAITVGKRGTGKATVEEVLELAATTELGG